MHPNLSDLISSHAGGWKILEFLQVQDTNRLSEVSHEAHNTVELWNNCSKRLVLATFANYARYAEVNDMTHRYKAKLRVEEEHNVLLNQNKRIKKLEAELKELQQEGGPSRPSLSYKIPNSPRRKFFPRSPRGPQPPDSPRNPHPPASPPPNRFALSRRWNPLIAKEMEIYRLKIDYEEQMNIWTRLSATYSRAKHSHQALIESHSKLHTAEHITALMLSLVGGEDSYNNLPLLEVPEESVNSPEYYDRIPPESMRNDIMRFTFPGNKKGIVARIREGHRDNPCIALTIYQDSQHKRRWITGNDQYFSPDQPLVKNGILNVSAFGKLQKLFSDKVVSFKNERFQPRRESAINELYVEALDSPRNTVIRLVP